MMKIYQHVNKELVQILFGILTADQFFASIFDRKFFVNTLVSSNEDSTCYCICEYEIKFNKR